MAALPPTPPDPVSLRGLLLKHVVLPSVFLPWVLVLLQIFARVFACLLPDSGKMAREWVIVDGLREGVVGSGVPFCLFLPFATSVGVLDSP